MYVLKCDVTWNKNQIFQKKIIDIQHMSMDIKHFMITFKIYVIQKPGKLEGVSEKGVLFYWTYSFRLNSAAPGAKNSQQSQRSRPIEWLTQ